MKIKISEIQYILLAMLGIELLQLEIPIFCLLFVFTILLLGRRTMVINKEMFFLFICFVVNYVILLIRSRETLSLFFIIRSCFGPIMGYIIGELIVYGDFNKLKKVIYILGISIFLHGCLNLFSTHTLSTSSRSVTNFWTGGITTATLQATYFAMSTSIATYLIFFKGKIYKFFGSFILAICIWNSMLTASRTPLFLLGIMFFIGYLVKNFSKGTNKGILIKSLKIIICTSFLLALFFTIYNYDFFNLKTNFEQSFLGIRLAGIENENALSRPEIWGRAIMNIYNNPFGYNTKFFAHNLWLDLGQDSGIIPLLFLIIYFILILKSFYKNVIKNEKIRSTKYLVLFIYISLIITFMLEPILQGIPFLFICFCIINGGVDSLKKVNFENIL